MKILIVGEAVSSTECVNSYIMMWMLHLCVVLENHGVDLDDK